MSNNYTAPTDQRNAAWEALHAHKQSWDGVHMRDLFKNDTRRFDLYHLSLDGLLFDFSKNLINGETLSIFSDLAAACGVQEAQAAMLRGEPLNHSEGRAVLHSALRTPLATPVSIDGEDVGDFVGTLKSQIKALSDALRAGDSPITDVVHIGVGGSDLGPHLVCRALTHLHDGPRLHFLNNIDGQSIVEILDQLDPHKTAVLIASKTFTTLETSTNADHARAWLSAAGLDLKAHLYAMSAAPDKAEAFGIDPAHIVPMRDWIGGRFSLWSSIGLPIAIALGYDVFEALLGGARRADEHVFSAPFDRNIAVIMASLTVWHRNGFDYTGHAILPYNDALGLLPIYMQQLEMESNGKHSDAHKTAPLVIGGVGTCAQHAFMQALHQSGCITPADFIVIAHNPRAPERFQTALNANALAQAQALMQGREDLGNPQRHFPGNRPSSTILLPELTPHYLGMLLALYEHKIFIEGILWGINSFDQWGVELGKTLAKDIMGELRGGAAGSHDSSTTGLIRAIIRENSSKSANG